MDIYYYLTILCIGALLAGFIDAAVGGGGLIQVPLLFILIPSLSHVQVIATNRFASLFGTMVAAFQYSKKIKINLKLILILGIPAIIFSYLGTFIMARISPEIFKPILLVIICLLAIYTFIKKDFGTVSKKKYSGNHLNLFCLIIGTGIGLYNGVIGPGTGVLLVFSLVSILGSSFIHASASAKIVNALADAASLIAFILSKAIVYKLALPMMVCNMVGSYIGSKTAISKGNEFIRYVFLLVISILIIRLARDISI